MAVYYNYRCCYYNCRLSITETTAADASSVDLAAVIKPMVFFNEGLFIRYIYITVYEKHGLC